jgi:hypothetical protein
MRKINKQMEVKMPEQISLANRCIDFNNEIKAYEKTLRNLSSALKNSFNSKANWGIAGLREESLVLFLAESIRTCGWDITYEKRYENTFYRSDVVGSKNKVDFLIEAKWWWIQKDLDPVLELDISKLKIVRENTHAIAVIFTVDEENVKLNKYCWTLSEAGKWMESLASNENLSKNWQYLGSASSESMYEGSSFKEKNKTKVRKGIFTASFFEYIGKRNS